MVSKWLSKAGIHNRRAGAATTFSAPRPQLTARTAEGSFRTVNVQQREQVWAIYKGPQGQALRRH